MIILMNEPWIENGTPKHSNINSFKNPEIKTKNLAFPTLVHEL